MMGRRYTERATMLDGNGCIVGDMQMSNLDLSFAAGAVVRYTSA